MSAATLDYVAMSDDTDQKQVYFFEWRKKAGLTQQQAAERLGYSRNYLSELERGRDYNSRHLEAMAKVYGCSVSDLFRDPNTTNTKWASIFSRIPADRRDQAIRTAESFAEDQAGYEHKPNKQRRK
jgi:transcriptional regulator with XRE-family HTH domain